MNFPQYHVPTVSDSTAMFAMPITFISLGVFFIILTAANIVKIKVGGDKYDSRATVSVIAFFVTVLVGVLGSYYGAFRPHYEAQEKAEAKAVQTYRGEVVSYIDNVYGVKITKASARDLVKGKETAGVAPSGETITLSLLNRDQKNPVLIGTDHNPIPKYDRLTAE